MSAWEAGASRFIYGAIGKAGLEPEEMLVTTRHIL